MVRLFVFCSAFFGFTAVALGAFAAHGLKGRLPAESLAVLQTGVNYQMWHALALLAVALLHRQQPGALLGTAGWAFILGVLLFSGSLYLMTLGGLKLGLVTPAGGVCFLIGWACLAVSALKLAR